MKKPVALLLCILLVSTAMPALAVTAVSPAEMCDAVDVFHTRHQAEHTMLSATIDENGLKINTFFPEEAQDTYMGCLEVYLPEARDLPMDAASVYEVFLSMFYTALGITSTLEDVTLMDLERIPDQLNQSVQISVPAPTWWASGHNDQMEMMMVPILLVDKDQTVIDDTVYTLVIYATDSLTGHWICADQEIVREMLQTLITQPDDDGSAETAYLLAWLSGEEPEPHDETADATDAPLHTSLVIGEEGVESATTPAPEEAVQVQPLDARAIGTVTVTQTKRVNLREEDRIDSPSLAYAYPGDVLQCIGIAPSGWYEVLLEDGQSAFIGSSLVSFEEHR